MHFGITVILCCFYVNLSAQQHHHYTFRHIDQRNGLQHNNVLGIRQDARGFIWILTPNGLQRYDGNRFVNYRGIVNNAANGMTDGAELYSDNLTNEVWVMKKNSMERLALTNNRSVKYDSGQVLNNPAYRFTTYTDKINNRYLVGEKGIFILSPVSNRITTSISNIQPPGLHEGNKMARDSLHNQTWLIAGSGLLLFDGNTKQVYSTAQNEINNPLLKLSAGIQLNQRLIMTDSRSNVWITTWGNLFYRFNRQTGKLHRYNLSRITKRQSSKKKQDATLLINALYEDNHGNVWFATENAGLLLYQKETDDFEDIFVDKKSVQSIQYNFKINRIFQDKEDNIWLGTDKGISIFNPYRQYFKSIHHEENSPSLPNNEILNFIQTINGDILVATWGGGITIYDNQWNFKKQLVFPGPQQYNMVWCFQQGDDGIIWAGCQHGYVHLYNPATGTIQTIHPAEFNGSTIRCMAKDKNGNIWFGLHNGNIAEWNKQQHAFYSYNGGAGEVSNTGAPIFKIFIDAAQHFWVSTAGGFKEFDPLTRKYARVYLPDKKNPAAISGKSSQGIEALNDSTLIIGTIYGGLNFFNTRAKTFSHLTTDDGLPANTIYAIRKDTAGYIWFTTDYNLYRLTPGNKKFLHYNVEPGIINSSFNTTGFYALKDGTWLTATTTEIICFQPEAVIQYNKNPAVEIAGFKILDNPYFIDSFLYKNQPVHLTYKQNFITIEFALLNFSGLGQTKYYYRLSGINKDWVSTDSKNFASYTNLNPGEYIFSVRSENNGGVSRPATFTIIISPPFWQTGWFISGVISVILLLILLFIKGREKSIRAIAAGKLKVQQLSAEQYKSQLELEQIINYFTSSLIDKNTVDEVLWDVAKNLIGRLGFVDCMIYLWNEDKTKMIQKAGFGPKGSKEEIYENPFDVLPGQGVVGYVMQSKEPLLISDTSKDSRYRPDEMERFSEITVPVKYNNELIGVIDSEHPEKNFYTTQHLQVLSTIATLMANKIRSIDTDQLLQRTQIEMYSMNEQLSKARLEALRAQMNPHFIFNCLTSIDNLIQMDEKEKATLYLSKFARLIRSILENSNNDTVPCWKDMETLQLYLELEALRFDNKFSYRLIISEEILNGDYKVPPLVIQPFVENAIHHGLLNKIDGDKQLVIHVTVDGNLVHYLIEDNGVGRVQANAYKKLNRPSHRSMGMQITTDRINLFNQNKNGFIKITDLANAAGEPCGTRVNIELINQP